MRLIALALLLAPSWSFAPSISRARRSLALQATEEPELGRQPPLSAPSRRAYSGSCYPAAAAAPATAAEDLLGAGAAESAGEDNAPAVSAEFAASAKKDSAAIARQIAGGGAKDLDVLEAEGAARVARRAALQAQYAKATLAGGTGAAEMRDGDD